MCFAREGEEADECCGARRDMRRSESLEARFSRLFMLNYP
jgi:hypothetical protein